MSSIKRPETKLVPVPSVNKIPERDVDKSPILEAQHLGIAFGGLTAVDDFNIAMGRTEISGLIGPNGAGKTTIFNLLTSVYKPTRGTVLVDGYDTASKSVAEVNRMGVARTFQNIRLFSQMSVLENVLVGYGNAMRTNLITDMLRLPGHWRQEAEYREKALELLDIFDMRKYADTQAGNLPYGAQRRLEILRALATGPKVLLLDEPAAGMNPQATPELTISSFRCSRFCSSSRARDSSRMRFSSAWLRRKVAENTFCLARMCLAMSTFSNTVWLFHRRIFWKVRAIFMLVYSYAFLLVMSSPL